MNKKQNLKDVVTSQISESQQEWQNTNTYHSSSGTIFSKIAYSLKIRRLVFFDPQGMM